MSLRVAFDLDGTLADMEHVLRQEAARLFPSIRSTPSTRGPEESARSGQAFASSHASGAGSGVENGLAQRTVDAGAASGNNEIATEDVETAAQGSVDGPPARNFDLTSRQWVRLWAHVRRTEDFWLSLPEIDEGIVAHIAAVAARRRWEVLFITTRPLVRGQTTQAQTQQWLQTHGFPIPSVYVVQRSRGLIAQALELDAVVDDRLENCVDVALESKAVPILIRPSSARTVSHESRPVGVRVVPSIREAIAVLEKLDDERRQPGVVRSLRKWLGRS